MKKEMLSYFKGEKEFCEYCLLELDGETRMKFLEINSLHFSSKKEAKKWYEEIKAKIENPMAKKTLENLYNQMA